MYWIALATGAIIGIVATLMYWGVGTLTKNNDNSPPPDPSRRED